MLCGFPIQYRISRVAQNFYGTGNSFKIVEVIFDRLSDHIGTRAMQFCGRLIQRSNQFMR